MCIFSETCCQCCEVSVVLSTLMNTKHSVEILGGKNKQTKNARQDKCLDAAKNHTPELLYLKIKK